MHEIIFWYKNYDSTKVLETGLPSFDTVCAKIPVLIFAHDGHTARIPWSQCCVGMRARLLYCAFLSILVVGFIYVYLL